MLLPIARRRDQGEEAMLSTKGGGTRWITVVAILTAVALASSDAALAGPDPLSTNSSVTLQLRSSGGLKLKPKTLALPVNAGSQLDPTTGAGTIQTNRGFKARSGGRKTKVKITLVTLGANGGPGSMDAKVGKRKVKGFAKLSGGTLTRDGWGAKLDGVAAKLGKKGAKALRQALSPGSAKKASASAGGIKAGKPLGTASVISVPQTVEVLPGGTLVLEAAVIPFGVKLVAHCINATLGGGGVEVIPPAVQSGDAGEIFTFPVTGGSIAPDFSDGAVLSAGGQRLTKTLPGPNPPGCTGPPPLGTHLDQTGFQAQFGLKALAASVTVSTAGPLGLAVLGDLNLASATSADVNTKQLTVTNAPVTLSPLAAGTLNSTFPNGSLAPSNNFAAGDLIGHVSLNVTTH
jgi:hypothetical protein